MLKLREVTMKQVLASFQGAISLNGKQLEVERKFQQYQEDGNTEDMFRYIYNMEEAHTFLRFHIDNDFKDEILSTRLREEGNVFYKKKKLKEALVQYNKCIFSAPHPNLLYDKTDNEKYTPLALGYGNRSAVLYDLKEYEICIYDIDRSLNLCNSESRQFKLLERKVNCLIAIGRHEEAKELLQKSPLLLNNFNSLSNLLQHCSLGTNKDTYQDNKQECRYEEIKHADPATSFSNDDLIFAYNNPSPPSLDDEPNSDIPAFSCALKLKYSKAGGRYVVASRDIKPGEVIAVETAYTSCVNSEDTNSQFSFCTYCLARCAAPLPCPECTKVVFCNEECRSKAWDKFHMKECPVYDQLHKLQEGFIQAYRTIARHTLDELKVFVSQFQSDKDRYHLQEIIKEDLICDSDAYRGWYFLEGNIKSISTDKLVNISINAFLMTYLLIHSNRFFDNHAGDKSVPDEKDIVFIGSLFIRHLLGVLCNSFTFNEGHAIADKKSFIQDQTIGYGTFIAQSLFNHSCIPSLFHFFYGNVGVCRANRWIRSGNEVYVCYFAPYYNETDQILRRESLYDAHSFMCNCEACINNYRLSFSNLKFVFTTSKLRSRAIKLSKKDNKRTVSLEFELDTLVERNQSMIKKFFESQWSDVKDNLDLLLETIEFFDRNVVVPDQMYTNLTHMFGEMFGRQSSGCFVNEAKVCGA